MKFKDELRKAIISVVSAEIVSKWELIYAYLSVRSHACYLNWDQTDSIEYVCSDAFTNFILC